MEGKPPSPEGLGEQNYRQHHNQDQSDEDDEGLLFVGHGVHPLVLGLRSCYPSWSYNMIMGMVCHDAEFPFSAGGATVYPRVDRALMLNKVQKVPHYRRLSGGRRWGLLFFDPGGIDWEGETVTGLLLKDRLFRAGRFAFPRTVYNRCFPEPRDIIGKLSTTLGAENIFNECTHLDKLNVHQHLEASEVGEYLPQTCQYSPEDLVGLLGRHVSLVFKPRLGHGGAKVLKVTFVTSGVYVLVTGWGWSIPILDERILIAFLLAAAPPQAFIAQEYIESATYHGRKFDVRIVMQKNGQGRWEVGGQLSRLTAASNLLTNHYEAIVSVQDLLSPVLISLLQSLSFAVAKTLDGKLGRLGELGVDYLLDTAGRPWILEVNGKPDKSLFRKLGNGNMLRRVYLNPLEYQGHLLS